MSDISNSAETGAESGAETGQITYHEKPELGFLERILLDRRLNWANALLFACATISIGLALFHLLAAVFGTPEGRSFRSVHLTVMLVLAVLMHPLFRGSMREPVLVPGDGRNPLRAFGFGIDLVLVALVLFVQLWTVWDIDAFHMRYGEKETPDLIVGGILIFVCATYIILFIIFGAVLIRSGAGRFFIDLAVSLTGHRRFRWWLRLCVCR